MESRSARSAVLPIRRSPISVGKEKHLAHASVRSFAFCLAKVSAHVLLSPRFVGGKRSVFSLHTVSPACGRDTWSCARAGMGLRPRACVRACTVHLQAVTINNSRKEAAMSVYSHLLTYRRARTLSPATAAAVAGSRDRREAETRHERRSDGRQRRQTLTAAAPLQIQNQAVSLSVTG